MLIQTTENSSSKGIKTSQQAVVMDLMFDAALKSGRQVILASHSPEIISRVPAECLRWVDRDSAKARGGEELRCVLERLGATPDIYVPESGLPEVLVYVEGITDRPVLEALIKWCRQKAGSPLPTTMVIPHRDGRFESPTLHGIARFARESGGKTEVVGVRDLDWYYHECPPATPEVERGEGWSLITLPCKEMENLFCDQELLFQGYEQKIASDTLQAILDEESSSTKLVQEWKYQVLHRIRHRSPKGHDESTKEKTADETFESWCSDDNLRRRLVAGKTLLRRVQNRIRSEHGLTFYPSRVFQKLSCLPPSLLEIAKLIFPGASFDSSDKP